MNLSILELWGSMGWFARGIVGVLLLMSVYAAAVALRKSFRLRRARKSTLKFSPLFSNALARRDFLEAERLVQVHPDSHLAASFRRVFPSLVFRSWDQPVAEEEIAAVQRAIEINTLEGLAEFRRGLGVMATTGATAPFVGLLGTVVGVVNAFTGMAVSGSAGIAAISAGIAEALVATAFGLLVAIPAVWAYNYFANRIDEISMEITYACKELIDYLLRDGTERTREEAASRFETPSSLEADARLRAASDPPTELELAERPGYSMVTLT